jgi:hypothetical protein
MLTFSAVHPDNSRGSRLVILTNIAVKVGDYSDIACLMSGKLVALEKYGCSSSAVLAETAGAESCCLAACAVILRRG